MAPKPLQPMRVYMPCSKKFASLLSGANGVPSNSLRVLNAHWAEPWLERQSVSEASSKYRLTKAPQRRRPRASTNREYRLKDVTARGRPKKDLHKLETPVLATHGGKTSPYSQVYRSLAWVSHLSPRRLSELPLAVVSPSWWPRLPVCAVLAAGANKEPTC